jgi:hypothetical protein
VPGARKTCGRPSPKRPALLRQFRPKLPTKVRELNGRGAPLSEGVRYTDLGKPDKCGKPRSQNHGLDRAGRAAGFYSEPPNPMELIPSPGQRCSKSERPNHRKK